MATAAHASSRNLKVVASNAQAQKRVALVIGNAKYQGAPPLRNPVNDAHAMSNALNALGFEVIEVTDASQKEMNHAIAEFGQKLTADTAALFFYAGHGLQVKGKNYIVPVDAQISGEAAVRAETVDMDTVMDQLNAAPVSIVILDACRNNPFERSFRKMGGGLAQMDAPKGSFIAYATAPGKTAADGEGKNGLFTQELLKQINAQGLSLEEVFKRVRANVLKATSDAQMPWDSSSMTGSFYFKPGKESQVASLEPVPLHVKTKDEIEQETWESARDNNDIDSVSEYLKQYPTGKYVGLANILYKKLRKEASQAQQHHEEATQPTTNSQQAADNELVMVAIPGKNYEIGKYDVTQGEWKAVMGSNPSHFSNCGDNCPVETVSWDAVKTFLQKLNAKTGKQYRLPTEKEWEYACYGGSQTEYCGGNDIDAVAWYESNSGKQTHPVGQKQANGYGLYDMSGNVWQWMENKYDNEHDWRTLRGGSWFNGLKDVRAAYRFNYDPALRLNIDFGFRLARTLPTESAQPVTQQAAAPKGYVSQGGLTWMPISPAFMNWADANAYCNNTAINGQTGWRLPTKDELNALYASKAMNGQGWTLFNTWSSSSNSGDHFRVNLAASGQVDTLVDPNISWVTCVR